MLRTRAEVGAELVAARTNPFPLIEKYLYIVDAEGEVRPLFLNQPQRMVATHIIRDLEANRPVRYFILKARREGMSTMIEALIFVMSLCWSYMRGTVLTHERELSQELMSMSTFFLENLGADIRPAHPKPTANRIWLSQFECSDGVIPLKSRIGVDTATGKESGRGKANRFLHLSEAAFYPDPKRALSALLPTVPKRPNTFIFIETTANGMGTDMHRRWLDAERGEGMFRPIFIPWFWLEMNTIDPPEDFKPTREEYELAMRFNLSDSQLYWRRVTIRDDFEGDLDLFYQEHPSTADEAWRHSGDPAFSKSVLITYKETAMREPPPERGDLQGVIEVEPHEHDKIAITFKPDPLRGLFKIFERPIPGEEYLIGADTALGVPDGDKSSAAVVRRRTNRIVATYLNRIDPRAFAYVLARLGYWYNEAVVAPEANNTGLPTLIELKEHLFYPRIYRWRKYDNATNAWTEKLGWWTLDWTRALLLDDMTMGLRSHLIGIPSVELIDELMVVDTDKDKPADDDLATGAMIAWHCHLVTPMQDGTMPRAVIEPKEDVLVVTPTAAEDMTREGLTRRMWDRMDQAVNAMAAKRGGDVIIAPNQPSPEQSALDWALRLPS